MGVRELLQTILKETDLKAKDIAESLSITEKQLKKWQNYTAVPTKYQLLNLLYLASLFDVDTSAFRWEKYIEIVLSLVFNDDYCIADGIDKDRYMIHLRRIDGTEGYVPLEDISTRKKDLFADIQ